MNNYKFRDGMKLKAIFPSKENLKPLVVGYDAIDIEVVMQNGQMADIAWARVVREDGKIFMVNLNMVTGVEFFPEKVQP